MEGGVGRWGGGTGNSVLVDGEIGVGGETDLGVLDCGVAGEVEVAGGVGWVLDTLFAWKRRRR